MSITVTPATSPLGVPRMQLSISSTNGAAITSVFLARTANAGAGVVNATPTVGAATVGFAQVNTVVAATDPTRVQPTPGPSPRTVNDYEADWDTNVVYTATVTTASGTETFTSGIVTLTAANPWAIHPTSPALSFPLAQATTQAAGIRTLGSVSRDATDTAHTVLGSPYRVYTTTGPRSAPTITIEFTTTTTLEAQAVRAALNDLTPLLFRVPASYGWDFESGYYRVGQTEEARVIQYGADQGRIFTLPLERVEQPAGTQQSERTWANVLNDFASWNTVRAAYANWTNVITDTRG